MSPDAHGGGLPELPPTSPLVATSAEMFDKWLECLFWSGDHPDAIKDMVTAFENLAAYYVETSGIPNITPEAIRIDYHGLRLMLTRFQRDVYGVAKMHRLVDSLVNEKRLNEEDGASILRAVGKLGVRVNSHQPFMTRRAAVFSLWMCAFRPASLYFKLTESQPIAALFPAGLNFFIAKSYLQRTGKIDLGEGRDRQQRLSRIHHDFTFREVNLSSLEFFYAGIYRKNPGDAEGPADGLDGAPYGAPGDIPAWHT